MAALIVLVVAHSMNRPPGTSDVGPWLEAARRSALAHTGGEVSTKLESRSDVDDDEEALHAYNAMLARLADGRRTRQ